MKTPVSAAARAKFAAMPALDAAIRAWNDHGIQPGYHAHAKNEVRKLMPLLAESLDRLTLEGDD